MQTGGVGVKPCPSDLFPHKRGIIHVGDAYSHSSALLCPVHSAAYLIQSACTVIVGLRQVEKHKVARQLSSGGEGSKRSRGQRPWQW